ncbi:MAG TPA: MFS transporter [Candidatus Limnocylindrales bacterium]|nr:MFS transporter [Candidatus Limnocylindrales bacterium]
MLRLSLALFLVQAGFHGFTASIPLALSRAGRPDAEIGILVGLAALVQVPAALAGGALIDRFGGMRLFALGGVLYLISCGLLLLPGLDPAGSTLAIAAARGLQGAGFGLCVPAALAVVPLIVPFARRGVALATTSLSHNMTLVVLPPLSIVVLDASGLDGVTLMVAALVVAGLGVAFVRSMPVRATVESNLGEASRRFGFAFRRSWLAPLAITTLFVIHWGVITAYMPQRAELAGANIGLFFAADGLFVLLSRLPAGWIADRTRPIWPVLAGIALTFVAVLLLLPLPTTPILIVSGSLTGIGAALIIQPLLLALTRRSSDADRGSAFALFSACFAAAIVLGTIGTAPLIDPLGFETVLLLALGALLASAGVAIADRGLRSNDEPSTGPSAGAEGPTDVATPIGP